MTSPGPFDEIEAMRTELRSRTRDLTGGDTLLNHLFDVTEALKRAHDYAAEMQLGAEGFDNTQTAGYFNGVRQRFLAAATEIEVACRSLLE